MYFMKSHDQNEQTKGLSVLRMVNGLVTLVNAVNLKGACAAPPGGTLSDLSFFSDPEPN